MPRFAIPLPPQVAVLAAALALGFGGVIGSALSPGVQEILAAATALPAAPVAPVEQVASTGGGGGSGGSSGGSASVAPATSTSTVAPSTIPTTPLPVPIEEEPLPEDELPAEDETPADDEGVPDDGTTVALGTVVRVNPEAESYSLASGAAVSTIHTDDLPNAGASVSVPTLTLFNGTLEEAGDREENAAEETATFSGTVTFVDEEASLYVVSSAGASIPVHAPDGDKTPPLASLATVEVAIEDAPEPEAESDGAGGVDPTVPVDPGATAPPPSTPPADEGASACAADAPFPEEAVDPQIRLTQESFTVDFEDLTTASLEGIVQASCPELDQIVVSADDLRETGQDLVLATPDEVDAAAVEPGESVTLNANPVPTDDGTLELFGIAGDEGVKGADDEKAGQGDKAGRRPLRRRTGRRCATGRPGRSSTASSAAAISPTGSAVPARTINSWRR